MARNPTFPALFAVVLALLGTGQAYHLYYANLHCHTGYSDGDSASVPRDAYIYARDTARIDVLATSDHGELLADSAHLYAWDSTKAMAAAATEEGRFLAIAGFEWSSTIGHVNVLFTNDYTSALRTPTVPGLYLWMSRRDTVVGQFNHPDTWHFGHFRYSAQGDSNMCECEMQNTAHALVYTEALDSGWQVGVTANQDNHYRDWGALRQLTGIWAETLTRSSIYDAVRRMRTFGSLHRRFSLQFTVNDSWMGATIPDAESIRIHVIGQDSNPSESIRSIEILTDSSVVAASRSAGDTGFVDWEVTIPRGSGPGRYYFARVILDDTTWVQSSAIRVAEPTGATEGSRPTAHGSRLLAWPNPFSDRVTFQLPLTACRTSPGLRVYDAGGRLVRNLAVPRPPTPDPRLLTWDGRDMAGRPVASGVYFVSLEGAGGRWSGRILKKPRMNTD